MKLLLLMAISLHAESIPYYDLSGTWRLTAGDQPRDIRIPARGQLYGRYRLERSLRLDPGVRGDLAIVVDAVAGSYRVSINGVAVGEAGRYGEGWVPVSVPRSFRIPAQVVSDELRIGIEVESPSLRGVRRIQFDNQVGSLFVTSVENARARVESELRRRQVRQAVIPISAFTGFLFAFLIWLSGRRGKGEGTNGWLALALAANAVFDLGITLRTWAWDLAPEHFISPTQSLAIALVPGLSIEFGLRYLALRVHWLRWLVYAMLAAATFFWNGEPVELGSRFVALAIYLWLLMVARRSHGRDEQVVIGLLAAYQLLTVLYRGGLIPQYFDLGPVRLPQPPLFRWLFGLLMVVELQRRAMADREERQRLSEELAAARQVQSLLVESAVAGDRGGYRIESSYLPAREVGGDFYQVWETGRGVMVAVGDVSGKGLKAAMMVSLVVGALRRETSDEPGVILRNLNGVLCKGKDPAGFVTCCVLRLEGDGVAVVANAGHLPPYADGVAVELEGALPLGIDADAEYTERRIAAAGQWMLVSDGVVEAATPQGELFGFDRTAAMSGESAAELVEAARVWGQNDDITVVTVRRAQ